MKPILAVTAGDPLGIGPEVTVKALQDPAVRAAARFIVVGEPATLYAAGFTDDLAALLPVEHPQAALNAPHAPCSWAGEVSFKALQTACKLTAGKKAQALVTAPISKQSWALAGVEFTGHTEFLRRYYGPEALMMFISGPLRCALVSEHFALADLPRILTQERITHTARQFAAALQRLHLKNPQIAISALNPHAGDNGRFGQEENTVLAPAIKTLQQEGLSITGPYPIDSLWLAHARGKFDGLLCLYHDQALLGLKLAAREPIVHITAGLQFLRVSPTHGTAFDIAGQNRADPGSMKAALLFAAAHAR